MDARDQYITELEEVVAAQRALLAAAEAMLKRASAIVAAAQEWADYSHGHAGHCAARAKLFALCAALRPAPATVTVEEFTGMVRAGLRQKGWSQDQMNSHCGLITDCCGVALKLLGEVRRES